MFSPLVLEPSSPQGLLASIPPRFCCCVHHGLSLPALPPRLHTVHPPYSNQETLQVWGFALPFHSRLWGWGSSQTPSLALSVGATAGEMALRKLASLRFQAQALPSWRRQWQPTPVLLPGKSHGWRSLVGSSGVARSRTRLSDFAFTFYFHALEKEMATHSSILAWTIPGTEEPGGLPSMGSHRVGLRWLSSSSSSSSSLWDDFREFNWGKALGRSLDTEVVWGGAE